MEIAKMKQAAAVIFAVAVIAAVAAAPSPQLAMAGPAGQNAAPTIDGLDITSSPYYGAVRGTYRNGDKVRVRVSFSESVTVTGAPQLALTVGSQTRQAPYDSSVTTPKTLYFEYTVQPGDGDTDGISIAANSLTLNGGSIKSAGAANTDASLHHNALSPSLSHQVDGTVSNLRPSFASASPAYEAAVGILFRQTLPPAAGGDGALSYGASNFGRPTSCASQSGPSGSSGAAGSSVLPFPTGITYAPPGPTDTHGGTITVAANTAAMPANCFLLVVTDTDSRTDLEDVGSLYFSVAVLNDYDDDNDGLIDVDSLPKLNAIRWDLNGDGNISDADQSQYKAAFPNRMTGMGCLRDHDDNTATPKVAGCVGYELTANLDFDTDGDGATYTTATSTPSAVSGDDEDAYYNGGKGWKPIGDRTTPFTATFDGNGNTLSNLFIKDQTNNDLGLFGVTGTGCQIERLGLQNVNVTGYNNVGGLVGRHGCAISSSYAAGSVTGNFSVGGLVGRNGGTISASYAAVTVTGSDFAIGGLAGRIAADAGSSISASYATGSVTGSRGVGGLVGNVFGANPITASYATGPVTGSERVGGLVGEGGGVISASYATGSVTGGGITGGLVGRVYSGRNTVNASYATGSVTGTRSVGGLVGWLTGSITNSYATGAVKGSETDVGGLVGFDSKTFETGNVVRGTATNSYWDTGTTGQAASPVGAGKTTRDLQSPAGYSDIYAAWNTNLDGIAGNDNPWDFGANRQYPVLNYGGLAPSQQRQVAIRSDNWNAPVVGEPVVASLDVTGATGIAWQWQSSTNGSTWTDIANATSSTYLPVAADAASGGKFLRAKVTFTVSGSSRTLTTVNTAKVIAATTAAAATAVPGLVPVVGVAIRYDLPVTGAADHAWRWQRCDNAGMTTNCAYVAASTAATTEYTPVAGDVGKYLRAYAYYAANDAGKTWTRTETPVLGPVVAAPAASP